ncbi:peptidoglycan DD-metalloendopeptidase family protein [Planococcus sp. APC 3906]|uniref:murein hydrolase activator EnvC family protein n=1 Tax=Planococcus sp. APC 3906 TaxID=3035194 RepID=UPI0025B3FAEE|nr:M23 family metallopeptidase [Planococcus sp. APC 3906]MDN3449441.1 peptidoglycan DD-metalloendopeptidase family protein [Planococcus sp. APC 3906]
MISKWMVTSLSSVLALSILIPTANAENLDKLEEKKQEAQQQQSELNSGINEKEGQLNQNATKLEQLAAKIANLNTQINETEAKINQVQSQIDQTKSEIDELRKSIEELEQKIAERTELLKERARAIQLSGGSVDYLDVLLGANSFVDFIDRFSAVNTLIDADREIMQNQADDKKALAEQKAQVESKLKEQEIRRSELVGLKASFDGQKKEQAGLVNELEAEQQRLATEKGSLEIKFSEVIEISEDLEKQIADEQARLAEIARKAEEERLRKIAAEKAAAEARAQAAAAEARAKAVAEARAQAAAEARAQATAKDEAEALAQAAEEEALAKAAAEEARAAEAREAANRSKASAAPAPKATSPSASPAPEAAVAPAPSSNAMFIRPVAGRYSSGYGGRDIGEGAESHLGQDIANATGTPISASASGYVSFAGVMGGYGNVVILTHSINGQSYATVYAHMSAISVSAGQAVSQGQTVGLLGSTGRSTGPHLHFEIHIGSWNGARSNAVNPMNYLQ